MVDCHNDAGSAGALVAAADGLDGVAGVLGVVGSILAMELHLNNNIAPINLLFRSRFILANFKFVGSKSTENNVCLSHKCMEI